jgi:hypothetical protein
VIFFLFVRIMYFVVLVLDEGRHAVDFSSRKNPTVFFLPYLVPHCPGI